MLRADCSTPYHGGLTLNDFQSIESSLSDMLCQQLIGHIVEPCKPARIVRLSSFPEPTQNPGVFQSEALHLSQCLSSIYDSACMMAFLSVQTLTGDSMTQSFMMHVPKPQRTMITHHTKNQLRD